ncbi:MAG: hypothetical protein AB7K24_33535, partial [Gemmataceae bacterium]
LLILTGFLSGSLLGLGFHRQDFLGGYGSFRRRLLRLGHIALVALGMLNVLFSVSAAHLADSWRVEAASIAFVVGGVAMPSVCFLSAWRARFRHLFFIPVTALVLAVVLVLRGY